MSKQKGFFAFQIRGMWGGVAVTREGSGIPGLWKENSGFLEKQKGS
ncbi:hypothetical protein T458_14585 [Brevibacillus panacihumi W25]|uniref:Uncharacterized protein n=1 Tax=Brevibacillus panacihumi W25 TaxID=1408254 RepID=V6M8P1_9BACL|nr:hypothetical protein T458_14585 [Brevibacillus panacihumi W25]